MKVRIEIYLKIPMVAATSTREVMIEAETVTKGLELALATVALAEHEHIVCASRLEEES